MFNAKLVTFSVSPVSSAMNVGELPELKYSDIDHGVSQSLVLSKDKAPICPYEDQWERSDQKNRIIELVVINPCRRNSLVSFAIKKGGEVNKETIRADDQGMVRLAVELRAGTNSVDLIGLDNTAHNILNVQATAEDDRIDQVVANGSVTMVGHNVLRRDGDEVTISHPDSGRTWTVRVKKGGEWQLQVPVSHGIQRFTISRPGNIGELQSVDVDGGRICEEQVEGTDINGTAKIHVVSPCRAGQEITFRHNDQTYPRQFNSEGKVELVLSLECGRNEVFFAGLKGGERSYELSFNCATIIKITLTWMANVDLDLHVQELDAAPNQRGWIYYGRMNNRANHDEGLGELDIDDQGKHSGTKVENYQLNVSRYPIGKLPRYYVVYFSRGTKAKLPYCGTGELASIPYRVTIIDRGQTEVINGTIESVPCGRELPPDPRIQGKQGPGGQVQSSVAPPIIAVDDQVSTPMNTAIDIHALVNDRAPPGISIHLDSVSLPSHGSTEILPSGQIRYRPAEGFDGTDNLIYKAVDDQGNGASARVQILVTSGIVAQKCVNDDRVTTHMGQFVVISVLANDAPDVDKRITVDQPSNGAVMVRPSGTVTYTPNANFFGTDTFSYRTRNASGQECEGVVTILVVRNVPNLQ